MNPCPCGHLGDPSGKCRCTSEQVQRYRMKISGPLLDRLDLHVEVPRVAPETLRNDGSRPESSEIVGRRACAARVRQLNRQDKSNARLSNTEVDRHCTPDANGLVVLERAMRRFALSARAYHRILKVARTIADLEDASSVSLAHVSEAIGLRRLDRAAKQ
jgi:magnesium chelatase family protein